VLVTALYQLPNFRVQLVRSLATRSNVTVSRGAGVANTAGHIGSSEIHEQKIPQYESHSESHSESQSQDSTTDRGLSAKEFFFKHNKTIFIFALSVFSMTTGSKMLQNKQNYLAEKKALTTKISDLNDQLESLENVRTNTLRKIDELILNTPTQTHTNDLRILRGEVSNLFNPPKKTNSGVFKM